MSEEIETHTAKTSSIKLQFYKDSDNTAKTNRIKLQIDKSTSMICQCPNSAHTSSLQPNFEIVDLRQPKTGAERHHYWDLDASETSQLICI